MAVGFSSESSALLPGLTGQGLTRPIGRVP